MWHQVELDLTKALNTEVKITGKQSVSGGDISQAFKINTSAGDFFVKVNKHSFYENFACEMLALNKIAKTQCIHTPKVQQVNTSQLYSYLILDYLEFKPAKMEQWYLAGVQLAKMHQHDIQAQFGFDSNNFIGSTLQNNRWHNNWSTFFAEQRIGFQLELLLEKGISIGDIDEIVATVHTLLKPRKPPASLLHGDLWQGNIAFANVPVIFDPASYYGDPEVDIAMSELFGCFPQEFYQGYQSVQKLDSGYAHRKHIYNFYHILNHANLFSGSYIEQSKDYLMQIARM
ncbi:fructosamine/Ketosamine-3-kinase [Catenovulum agarivorans DS-2]|uniref:Fructosamine/Ketosamine-3-kinase n=1 Tax=Catenovulum agarivorans DS-2 TaxID=1328313 RepID=W7QH64_9ALTE|nr:fructosamine kinase family protein [Catenovulum agarivorans]EWH12289.1 fructosamine/Ketosamine-3-kinase [Catenovulum agarivorans DS-2]